MYKGSYLKPMIVPTFFKLPIADPFAFKTETKKQGFEEVFHQAYRGHKLELKLQRDAH